MYKVFSFFVCVTLSSALHGMKVVLSPEIVRDIIIPHSLSHGDYDTYRTIAKLSKTHNKIVEDNRPIKKRIEESSFYKALLRNKTNYISWNINFSKCAVVSIVEARPLVGFDKKSLVFNLLGLDDNEQVRCLGNGSWDNFCFPAFENNTRPFFKKEGRVCFYGYGDIKIDKLVDCYCDSFDEFVTRTTVPITEQDLLEYSIGYKVERECYRCFFKYKDLEGSLLHFFNSPALLKAFLESTHVSKKEGEGLIKFYYLDGVTISEDYTIVKKHYGMENNEHLMNNDSLKRAMNEAIDAKYKEQQQEKSEQK